MPWRRSGIIPVPMSTPDTAPPPGKPARFWAMPNISVGLFILAVGAFLFFNHHQELDQRRMSLIEDLLWQEQSIRQHLGNAQESLSILAAEMMSQNPAATDFQKRAALLLNIYPEILGIYWVDEAGAIRWHSNPGRAGAEWPALDEESFKRARQMSRTVFSPVHGDAAGGSWFEIHVPLAKNRLFRGMLVARVSLPRILKHMVPWWYAQRYQLSIVDGDGRVLASKLDIAPNEKALSYQLNFEPPGYGLVLRATTHGQTAEHAPRLLEILIGGLSLLVVWSLGSLRKHIRHIETAERALRREYAFRTAMENSMATGIRAVDMEGRIIYVNPAFCRMVGWSAQELMGRLPPMPYWPQDAGDSGEVFGAMLQGAAPPEGSERPLRKKNGETLDVLIQSAPLIDEQGRQQGWMSSITDITERKQAAALFRQQEEKLQFTARLVTMGEMASSLAHELNQPLTAIASYATGALNRLRNEENAAAVLPAMEAINTQAQRAGKIIRNMREFVKKRDPQKTFVPLAELLEETAGFAGIEARRHALEIRLELEESLPPVNVDRIMIEQLILNLVRNGIEAMCGDQDGILRIGARRTGDGMVQVSVTDNGEGIMEETARQLFTPFFSTKPGGMGMGLNICRSIVEFHQGRLWHEPNPQGGTRFCFTLPLEN